MVENVEYFRAYFDRVVIVDSHLLDDAEIHILQPWPANAVEACSSVVVHVPSRCILVDVCSVAGSFHDRPRC